jgi:GST-like protein
MPAPIELHYWPTPNGHKISIALEEMGLPYEVRLVNINTGEQFRPDFLRIAPNNRMPAIVDPEGPDGAPISVFESGAILQYLSRKTGMFGGATERERIAVDEWLFWQMGGVGPMAGQANHFLRYAPQMDPPQVLPYAQDRYRREVGRLYGVLDRRLADSRFVVADEMTIADMAIYPWARSWEAQEQTLDDKPHMRRWLDEMATRPAVLRGLAVGAEARSNAAMDREAQRILFGQASRPAAS